MAELNVNLSAITQTATDIRLLEENISSNIQNIGNAIKKAKKSWTGSAINNLISKYEKFFDESEDFIKSLEAYSFFLEQSMGILDSVEKAIANLNNAKNSSEWK